MEEEDLDSIGLKTFYRKRLVKMLNNLKEGGNGSSTPPTVAATVASPSGPLSPRQPQDSEISESGDSRIQSPEVSRGDIGLSPDTTRAPPPTPSDAPQPEGLLKVKKKRMTRHSSRRRSKIVVSRSPSPSPESPRSPPPESSGELSSEIEEISSGNAVAELKVLLVELRGEADKKNDMGLLRGARACASKVMQLVESSDPARQDKGHALQSKIAAINTCVVGLVKSGYAPEVAANLNGLVDETIALL